MSTKSLCPGLSDRKVESRRRRKWAFRQPRFPELQEGGRAGRHSSVTLPPLACQAAVGRQVSVVNLDVGAGKVGHWGWGEQVQTTQAGYTPKVTEKTM